MKLYFTRLMQLLEENSSYATIVIALFVVLFMRLNSFGITSNEEFYLQIAHRRVEPENFGLLHAVFDFSNSRFLFEYLIGKFIAWFGFDMAHAIFRTGSALLFALSIGYFFNSLKLSAMSSVAIIAIFSLCHEQIIGGEWLFKGFESKIPAYICIFFGLGLVMEKKYLASIVAAIVSTYFHFLVGGFWVLALFGMCLLQQVEIRKILRLFVIYFLSVAPLIGILIYEQLKVSIPVGYDGLSPDKILQLRLPHHLAPFSTGNFLSTWAPSIIVTSLMLVFLLRIKSLSNSSVLINLVIGLLVYFLLAFVVSYIDSNTNLVGKFFLFRPSSLILFLFITACVHYLYLSTDETIVKFVAGGSLCVALYFLIQMSHVFSKHLFDNVPNPILGYENIVDAVKTVSHKNNVVLIQPYNEMVAEYASLPRMLDRQTLVSWKFNPTLPSDLIEWFARRNFKNQVFKTGCNRPLQYNVDYLLVLAPGPTKLETCGEVVWRNPVNPASYLIKVDSKWKPT